MTPTAFLLPAPSVLLVKEFPQITNKEIFLIKKCEQLILWPIHPNSSPTKLPQTLSAFLFMSSFHSLVITDKLLLIFASLTYF
jgi:hypothetical protein